MRIHDLLYALAQFSFLPILLSAALGMSRCTIRSGCYNLMKPDSKTADNQTWAVNRHNQRGFHAAGLDQFEMLKIRSQLRIFSVHRRCDLPAPQQIVAPLR